MLNMAEGVARLGDLAASPVVATLARAFADAGHELAIVGGPVRDALLGRTTNDLDFTTDALPDEILRIVTPIAAAQWDIGRAFGTIGARVARRAGRDHDLPRRRYDGVTRKPTVEFGDTLEADLARRDFTVNAMALRVPARKLVDPTGGVEDLVAGVLRTPGDPARELRRRPAADAARRPLPLAARLRGRRRHRRGDDRAARDARASSAPSASTASSCACCGPMIRCRGIRLLVDTGLIDEFLPEVSALRLEVDEHHHHKDVYEHSLTVLTPGDRAREGAASRAPRPTSRCASPRCCTTSASPRTRKLEPGGAVTFHHHDVVGSRMARKRLQALRFDTDTTDAVARLIELHLRFFGYAEGAWTDSAVRRYVRDAGDQLERLHILTRADVTTRNRRKAARLACAYDDIESRIAELAEQEELDAMRPELDGNRIQEVLGIRPGPRGRRGVPVPARPAPRRGRARSRRRRSAGCASGGRAHELTPGVAPISTVPFLDTGAGRRSRPRTGGWQDRDQHAGEAR